MFVFQEEEEDEKEEEEEDKKEIRANIETAEQIALSSTHPLTSWTFDFLGLDHLSGMTCVGQATAEIRATK